MYNYHCQYCNKDFQFQKPNQIGAHKRNCSLNPNRYSKEKKQYTFTCKKCGKQFTQTLSDKQYGSGRYKTYCSYSCSNSKKYYIYKTTNLINKKIYIGAHASQNIQKDKYMGSGNLIREAIKKYGKENFKRQILYQLKTQKQMYEKQAELVNQEFLKRQDVYNIDLGGKGGFEGKIPVKDKEGNKLIVSKDDPRYISGQLVHNNKGKTTFKDKDGNHYYVSKDDPRYLNKQLVGTSKGIKNPNLARWGKKNSNYGKPRTSEDKEKISKALKGKYPSTEESRKKTSEATKRGIKNMDIDKFNQFQRKAAISRTGVPKSEQAKRKISQSLKGRVYINNLIIQKKVKKQNLDQFLKEGWILGRLKRK